MRILNNKLLFLLAFFAYAVANTYAQNDTWLAVMVDGKQAQSYSAASEDFPSQFISNKWEANAHITDITYSPTGWRVVVGATKYTKQRWRKNPTFPADFVEKGWADNFNITTIAYGTGEWVVVMSKGTEQSNEIWASRKSLNEITAIIKENWKTKDIINVAYGNGEWVAVMAEGVAYDKQVYKFGATFPREWVQEKYDNGHNITSVAYGEGQWFVVMSKLPVQKNEHYNLSDNFPLEIIKSSWTNNRRLSILFFNSN